MLTTMEAHQFSILGGSNGTNRAYAPLTLCQEYGRTQPAPRGVLTVSIASGNGMMLRRKDFATLFHPLYFAYAEDNDLWWNAELRGLTIGWERRARLQHKNSTTKARHPSLRGKLIFHGQKNQIINYLVHYETKNLLRILPLFLMTQCAHVLNNPRIIGRKLQATAWILGNLRTIIHYRTSIQHTRSVPDDAIIRRRTSIVSNEGQTTGLRRVLLHVANRGAEHYCAITRLQTIETSQ